MTTTTTRTHQTADHVLDLLGRRLAGAVHRPGSDGYGRLATPFNLAVPVRPLAVVEAREARDVVEAVRFARRHGLQVGVQATGHGVPESYDGALLVHTGGLDECTVHPDGRARVGAGVRWQRVLDAAGPLGLAPLAGSSPHVGVVGYTTGGGVGPLARTFGFASDRVTAVELVTGDGVLRRCTATEHADLFWAVRGGKAAAGIVTALEFDLVPVAGLYAGALYFGPDDVRTVLHAWRRWCPGLPEQATTSVAVLQLPPLPGVPPQLAGRTTLAVRFTWVGDAAAGEAALAPLRAAATPVLDAVAPLPVEALGAVHADPVDPMPVHEDADLLTDLTDEAVELLLAVAGPGAGSPQAMVEIRQLGGALARAPRTPSALCHRDAAYWLLVVGVPAGPQGAQVPEHARVLREVLAPWATGATLPNLAPGTGGDRLARSYDAATLERLARVAREHDPDGVLVRGQVPVR